MSWLPGRWPIHFPICKLYDGQGINSKITIYRLSVHQLCPETHVIILIGQLTCRPRRGVLPVECDDGADRRREILQALVRGWRYNGILLLLAIDDLTNK